MKAFHFWLIQICFPHFCTRNKTLKDSVYCFDTNQANVSVPWNSKTCLAIKCHTVPGSYFTLVLSAPIYYINIITASPLWWNRAFISISAFISVTQTAYEEKSISSKANKDNGVTWCYSTVTTGSPLPTPVFIFSWVIELVAEGCVGWGTLITQDTFCSWICDWLYGQSLNCILTIRKLGSACVFCKNAEM